MRTRRRAAIRKREPSYPTKRNMESFRVKLAELRKMLPGLREDDRTRAWYGMQPLTTKDLEPPSAGDADVEGWALTLEAYYVAEELARDSAHSYLLRFLRQMRRDYEAEFGRPIPPRGRGHVWLRGERP